MSYDIGDCFYVYRFALDPYVRKLPCPGGVHLRIPHRFTVRMQRMQGLSFKNSWLRLGESAEKGKTMKKLIATTALVLSTATFAFAESHSQLAIKVDNRLAAMNIDVDMESLTDEQIASLYTALTSSEDHGEVKASVRAVMNDDNVVFEEPEDSDLTIVLPKSQLLASVRMNDEELGIEDVRLRDLSVEQLSALYLIATSTENASSKEAKAQAIVN